MNFVKTELHEEIVIKRIVTVHYFEYTSNYSFKGEEHDFWEFLYVDKGEVEVMAGDKNHTLKRGDIIFHKPNDFHNVFANGRVAPNLIVVSFECESKAMRYYEGKILSLGNNEKNILVKIVSESKKAYGPLLNNTNLKMLKKNLNLPFGCEQLIKINLELLLITLIRRGSGICLENKILSIAKEQSDNDLTNKIIAYLSENLESSIRFSDVMHYSHLSRTNLKMLFKKKMGTGVIEYYRKLKIEKAKSMIREGRLNFTQIANALKYNTVHYFSARFKKETGMTPTEYSQSVKAQTT